MTNLKVFFVFSIALLSALLYSPVSLGAGTASKLTILCTSQSDCPNGVCDQICFYPKIYTEYDIYSPNVTIKVNGSGFHPNYTLNLILSNGTYNLSKNVLLDLSGGFSDDLLAWSIGNYTIYANDSVLQIEKNITVISPYNFSGKIFNTDNDPVPSSLELYENNILVATDDEVYQFVLDYGKNYELRIYPDNNNIVSEVRVKNIINQGNLGDVLGLDWLAGLGFEEIFVYYPVLTNYSEVSIKINNTNNYQRAYKCVNWSFYERNCTGSWILIGLIENVSVLNFTRGDPAIGFTNTPYSPPVAQETKKTGSGGSWRRRTVCNETNISLCNQSIIQKLNETQVSFNLVRFGVESPVSFTWSNYILMYFVIFLALLILLSSYLYEKRVLTVDSGFCDGKAMITIKNKTLIWRRKVKFVYVIVESDKISDIEIYKDSKDAKNMIPCNVSRMRISLKYPLRKLARLPEGKAVVIHRRYHNKYLFAIHQPIESQQKIRIYFNGDFGRVWLFGILKHASGPSELMLIRHIKNEYEPMAKQLEKAMIDIKDYDLASAAALKNKITIIDEFIND